MVASRCAPRPGANRLGLVCHVRPCHQHTARAGDRRADGPSSALSAVPPSATSTRGRTARVRRRARAYGDHLGTVRVLVDAPLAVGGLDLEVLDSVGHVERPPGRGPPRSTARSSTRPAGPTKGAPDGPRRRRAARWTWFCRASFRYVCYRARVREWRADRRRSPGRRTPSPRSWRRGCRRGRRCDRRGTASRNNRRRPSARGRASCRRAEPFDAVVAVERARELTQLVALRAVAGDGEAPRRGASRGSVGEARISVSTPFFSTRRQTVRTCNAAATCAGDVRAANTRRRRRRSGSREIQRRDPVRSIGTARGATR